LFPVYAQQFKRRKGKVDCPQCGKRFEAVSGLIDETIPGGDLDVADQKTGERPTQAAAEPASAMTFGEAERRTGRASGILWSFGVLLLLAALVAQLFWWERGIWLGDPQVRQIYERICGETQVCPPLPRIAGSMEILEPVLAEHALKPRVLKLDVTLLNHFEHLQRPPLLHLELYDQDGNPMAVRRFAPDQYLDAGRSKTVLPVGSAINVAMEIASPPESPAGFRVKLY
jgi:hypothetical protein